MTEEPCRAFRWEPWRYLLEICYYLISFGYSTCIHNHCTTTPTYKYMPAALLNNVRLEGCCSKIYHHATLREVIIHILVTCPSFLLGQEQGKEGKCDTSWKKEKARAAPLDAALYGIKMNRQLWPETDSSHTTPINHAAYSPANRHGRARKRKEGKEWSYYCKERKEQWMVIELSLRAFLGYIYSLFPINHHSLATDRSLQIVSSLCIDITAFHSYLCL